MIDDARRSQVFGEDAETYDDARPGYPDAVIDLLVAHRPVTAVDVGCGTGKAGRAVVARGVDVLGLEPDPRMATVARRHGLNVTVTTVEEWTPVPRDLMFSGQAWHWVDHQVGAVKAATALSPGGLWAAFWNFEQEPIIQAALERAYQRFAPDLVNDRWTRLAVHDREEAIERSFAATDGFGPLERHEISWVDRLSVAKFVARLSTHSLHRLLEQTQAEQLHEAVVAELGSPSTMLELSYTTSVLTTRRR